MERVGALSWSWRVDVFAIFGCRNGHRRDSAKRIVVDGRLTDTVDCVARGAPEGVVVVLNHGSSAMVDR